jgi:ubiquinone/menaquinone biosynthesis C-methylase UbiE/transposase
MSSILNSLKLLSDPTRMRVFLLILREELSVMELQEILGMGQSRISTQLSRLKSEGLAEDRKVGKSSYYKGVAGDVIQALCEQLEDQIVEHGGDVRALRYVLAKRRDKARAYFDELAGKFGKHYVPGRSWKGLAEALIKILNYEVVADFGAGEGTLSQLMAQRAKKVIAVDNSAKMVEFGSTLAQEHGLQNLEYRLGDIECVPIDDASVDLVVFSQALHHAEKPERALAEAYRVLKPNGVLIVLDLLHHQYEQAREQYFDVWLGFSEVDLAYLIESEGFCEVEISVVDREQEAPYFQTLLGVAKKVMRL